MSSSSSNTQTFQVAYLVCYSCGVSTAREKDSSGHPSCSGCGHTVAQSATCSCSFLFRELRATANRLDRAGAAQQRTWLGMGKCECSACYYRQHQMYRETPPRGSDKCTAFYNPSE
ncbi:hypothetical protein EJ08DRAFT_443588 [Tothia fuscella]|uniref:Uncharacterized protein n=1 Tax=Tothia fuscella TaxID=1048955 RepID=A0A9P4NJ67_9PEZI|nr:hypothetical protein EJ08DRAFT_443588 [Tothia fuscella]